MLEQMAARGWMIQKAGNLFWTYTKIPPQKLRFAVTYFPGASEFDPKPSERQLEREELCTQDGWRLVLRWDAMQIFCTDWEDAVPIDTDPVPQVDNIHRTMRKKVLVSQLLMATSAGGGGPRRRRNTASFCRSGPTPGSLGRQWAWPPYFCCSPSQPAAMGFCSCFS